MATKIYGSVRFCHRADTLLNWQTENPVLLKGEIAVVLDKSESEKIKIGDGVTPWCELPFFKGPKGDKGDSSPITEDYINNILTFGYKKTADGNPIFIDDADITGAINIECIGQGDKNITLYSANIFDGSLRKTAKTSGGVTVQYLEDEDVYLINGTSTSTSKRYAITKDIPSKKGENYTCTVKAISGSVSDSGTATVFFGKGDGVKATANWLSSGLRGSQNTLILDDEKITASWFYIASGVTFNNYKVKIQLEQGQGTDYVPFSAETKTVGQNQILGVNTKTSKFSVFSDSDTVVKLSYKASIGKAIQKLQDAIISLGGTIN